MDTSPEPFPSVNMVYNAITVSILLSREWLNICLVHPARSDLTQSETKGRLKFPSPLWATAVVFNPGRGAASLGERVCGLHAGTADKRGWRTGVPGDSRLCYQSRLVLKSRSPPPLPLALSAVITITKLFRINVKFIKVWAWNDCLGSDCCTVQQQDKLDKKAHKLSKEKKRE